MILPVRAPASPRPPQPPSTLRLGSGRLVLIRPLDPDDDRLYPAFDARLTWEDRRLRFFSASHLGARQIADLTHYDRAKAAALAAIDILDGSLLGVARLHRTDGDEGEFAALVRSDMKGMGLGRELLKRVLTAAARLGVRSVYGFILRENVGMLALARDLGFVLCADPADGALIRARREAADDTPRLAA